MGTRIGTSVTASLAQKCEVEWTCSACGALNRAPQEIAVKKVVSGPAYPDAKKQQEMKDRANMAAAAAFLQIEADLRQRRYHSANFHCACSACRHREPWANMDYRSLHGVQNVLKGISMFFLGLLAFFLVFSLLTGGDSSFLSLVPLFGVPGVISLALFALLSWWERRNTANQQALVAASSAEALPQIHWTKES